ERMQAPEWGPGVEPPDGPCSQRDSSEVQLGGQHCRRHRDRVVAVVGGENPEAKSGVIEPPPARGGQQQGSEEEGAWSPDRGSLEGWEAERKGQPLQQEKG